MNTLLALIAILVMLAVGCNTTQQVSDRTLVAHSPIPTTSPPSVQTPRWLTYRNPEFGFTLQYPSDWQVADVQQLNAVANSGPLNGIFAISQSITTTDQEGEPMYDEAQFSIASESIPGLDIQTQSKEITASSNYTIGGHPAIRNSQDGPDILYTTIHVVINGTLLRINYRWSDLSSNGARDSNGATNKQNFLDTVGNLLESFK